ncbi:MAG TPA: hypothetical protein VGE90_09010 [Chitinophaga sp.]
MKLLPFLLILFSSPLLMAQGKEPDTAYHFNRKEITKPPYGLDKVQQLIASTNKSQNPDDTTFMGWFKNLALSDEDYKTLSLKEKFTYTMIHAEWFSQNCSFRLSFHDKEIPGYLPDAFDLRAWSTRQTDFLMKNRDFVMRTIKETVESGKRLGLNYKHAIVEINGWEMIPFMIKLYSMNHKDIDILTVLLQLMREGKYPPFTASETYATLYGPKSRYTNFLAFNSANEELIIKYATDFYNSKK